MIEPSVVARIVATTALAFGISGSAGMNPPSAAQQARCPYTKPGMLDAGETRSVPPARARTIWI